MQGLFYFFHHRFRCDSRQASVVAISAGLVAVSRARLAFKVGAEGVGAVLPPAVEAEVRVCGSPKAYDRCAYSAGKVHIGAVHRNHQGEVFDYLQLFGKGLLASKRGDVGVLGCQFFKLLCFFFTAKKGYFVASLSQHHRQTAGVFEGPYLAFMLGKRGNADGYW